MLMPLEFISTNYIQGVYTMNHKNPVESPNRMHFGLWHAGLIQLFVQISSSPSGTLLYLNTWHRRQTGLTGPTSLSWLLAGSCGICLSINRQHSQWRATSRFWTTSKIRLLPDFCWPMQKHKKIFFCSPSLSLLWNKICDATQILSASVVNNSIQGLVCQNWFDVICLQ